MVAAFLLSSPSATSLGVSGAGSGNALSGMKGRVMAHRSADEMVERRDLEGTDPTAALVGGKNTEPLFS